MFFHGGKTFKPAKKAVLGSRRFDLHKHAEATLGAGNLAEAVKLPAGENLNVPPSRCAPAFHTAPHCTAL